MCNMFLLFNHLALRLIDKRVQRWMQLSPMRDNFFGIIMNFHIYIYENIEKSEKRKKKNFVIYSITS